MREFLELQAKQGHGLKSTDLLFEAACRMGSESLCKPRTHGAPSPASIKKTGHEQIAQMPAAVVSSLTTAPIAASTPCLPPIHQLLHVAHQDVYSARLNLPELEMRGSDGGGGIATFLVSPLSSSTAAASPYAQHCSQQALLRAQTENLPVHFHSRVQPLVSLPTPQMQLQHLQALASHTLQYILDPVSS
jgi:hypothetical protein